MIRGQLRDISEQTEAKRRLRAALADTPRTYLFHGPPGVGKRAAAQAFASELLGEATVRSATRTPTCMSSYRSATRSGSTRSASLGRDLHMRPFEATAASTSSTARTR